MEPPFELTPSTPTMVHSAAQCAPGQASAQFRGQVGPPTEMFPGATARVAVAFDNCSGASWEPDAVAIRPATDDADRWGISRVALPGVVLDGRRAVLWFDVTAPAEAGRYAFAWQVVRGATDRMQVPSTRLDIVVRASADCREPGPAVRFRRQRAPEPFAPPGGTVTGELVFANCGTTPLSASDGVSLAYVGDSQRDRFGAATVALPNDVSPGSEVTIRVEARAPEAIGRYAWQWQIARAGEPFGERSAPTSVTVLRPFDCGDAGPPVRVLGESVPAVVDPGQRFDATVTLANCGDSAWDERWALRPEAPAQAGRWGTDRAALALPVGRGYQLDTTVSATAPGAPGLYAWRWSLGRDGEPSLQDATEPREVRVRCVPRCGDRNCGDDGCGGSCGSCGANASCEGGRCVSQGLSCGSLQWWNSVIGYAYVSSSGWYDTDLLVRADTPVALRHDSRLDRTGVYAWGYMPEFTDLVTGQRFRLVHLRPQAQYATSVGRVYPSGFIVGISGGDTFDTGYCRAVPGCSPVSCSGGSCVYSTGSHLCVQTVVPYRSVFPSGREACR